MGGGIIDTGSTVTNDVAEIFEPSVLDTVMIAEPSVRAVIKPFVTVATLGLLDDHNIA